MSANTTLKIAVKDNQGTAQGAVQIHTEVALYEQSNLLFGTKTFLVCDSEITASQLAQAGYKLAGKTSGGFPLFQYCGNLDEARQALQKHFAVEWI